MFHCMIRLRSLVSQLQTLFLVGLSLACSGCWEEVRYDPSQYDANVSPESKIQEVVDIEDDIQPTDNSQQASPTTGEVSTDDSLPMESSEPEKPEIEAAAQPDEPLVHVLDSSKDPSISSDSPAPPSEFDWFEGPSSSEPAELPESPASPQIAAAAWNLGSKWSLAAAYFAKGLGTSHTSKPLKQADEAALLLEIDLPALPENLEKGSLQAAMVRYLLEEEGPQLFLQLEESLPTEHVALAELAIKTHTLLLVYRPDSKDLEPLVAAIGRAAKNSGLPETVWRELIDLLKQRSDFASIKQAVFNLHDRAADYLGS